MEGPSPALSGLNLSVDHTERLAWFESRTGQVIGWPGALDGERFLAGKAKGILKPKGWNLALSVRIQLVSRYADGEPLPTADGGWLCAYHQEGLSADERDHEPTNRALMRNWHEGVPVAVFKQLPPEGSSKRYLVLGLAAVTGWADGYFRLESWPQVAGEERGSAVERALGGLVSVADTPALSALKLDPSIDAREFISRSIAVRRGQAKFRRELLSAYGGRCAISRSNAEPALEAAHLVPYRGAHTNDPRNGLLLRADLHTLMDLRLLAVEPRQGRIELSSVLCNTSYADFHGESLLAPLTASMTPDSGCLTEAWERFQMAELLRTQEWVS